MGGFPRKRGRKPKPQTPERQTDSGRPLITGFYLKTLYTGIARRNEIFVTSVINTNCTKTDFHFFYRMVAGNQHEKVCILCTLLINANLGPVFLSY